MRDLSLRVLFLGAALAASAPLACGSDGSSNPSTGGGAGGGGISGNGGSSGTASDASASGGNAGVGGSSGGCGTSSPEALATCVDPARYQADVVLVTGNRPPSTPHWQEVQDYCKSTLAGLGFAVELHDYGTGINVVGTLAGKAKPGERVLMGAHYDHIPGCPGADDNATGVAGVLELARVLSTASFDRTLVVVCFDEEESGLLGSKAYAARALQNGENLVAVTVFDMIGFINEAPNTQSVPAGIDLAFPTQYAALAQDQFRADFILLAHDHDSLASGSAMDTYAGKLGLKEIRLELPPALMSMNEMRRSDHASFWDIGYPAMFVGDSAELRYPAYHCKNGDDVIANLNFGFAVKVVETTVASVAASLGLSGSDAGSTGSGGSGGSGGSSAVTTCAGLCALAPSATVAQSTCGANALTALGYPITSTPACATVTTVAECSSCFGAAGVTDNACASVYAACF